MTETITEICFEEELSDESLDRTEAARACMGCRNDVRATNVFTGR
ncbi:MAG: hypothetical protein O3A96_16330 [Proteobacteria bacterium]|nr:hypothetical protein [Pseudomonadota bacterium]